jgi:hypothetical protein
MDNRWVHVLSHGYALEFSRHLFGKVARTKLPATERRPEINETMAANPNILN